MSAGIMHSHVTHRWGTPDTDDFPMVSLCRELNRENCALKAEIAGWREERKDLLDKNELARSKVEAMINRLRTME